MNYQIFRQYDIRAIIGKELKIEETYDLAKGIITYFKQKNKNLQKIIIGRDGRTHSLPIQEQVMQAAIDLGLDVVDIGLCTTPAFYFSLHILESSTGMIITASHNPGNYNGIKTTFDQKPVWGEQIQEIKEIILQKKFYINKTGTKGSIQTHDITTQYIDWLCNHFAHLKGTNIDTIIDCGNGTAGTVFPKLIKKMDFKNVKLMFEQVDGTFPNHEADPTVVENMKQLAQELKNNPTMTLGIGLDGDCDRMNPMTKDGFLVPGDQLLAVYAQPILKNHPHAAVAFDIKASSSLIDLLKSWGAKDCISPSGHAYIKQTMAKHNAILAGELSCHLFFKDRYFGYDDGIYGALRLIEIIQHTGKNLAELIKIFPKKERSREIRMKCTDETKHSIVENVKKVFASRPDAQTITIDGIRAQLDYGWGLIRVSNTQPVICLRFESDTKQGLQKIKHDFYKALQPYFDDHFLKEHIELQ
jgi:phosphomannomutase/phosphoglucomutase